MTVLAAIRPDDWDFPLLLHVLGAAVLVGAVLVASWSFFNVARGGRDGAALTRFGFRTLLIWALPAYILMRVFAQVTYDKENFGDEDPAWIGIGFIVADLGLLLLIISAVLTGIGARRLAERPDASTTLVRVAAGITALLLVLYVVAVWAMTGKPD